MTQRRGSLWKRRRRGLIESLEARIVLSVCEDAARCYEGSTAHATPIPAEVRQYEAELRALSGDNWQTPVPSGTLHPLTDIPALSSLPGAPATLYLDFDGHFEPQWGYDTNVTTPAFDQDGDPSTFSDAELTTIENITRAVAEDYAPFNINVTTLVPNSFANGASLRASVGGNGSWVGGTYGGIAYVDSFTNSIVNTVYIFPKNLANGYFKFTADAISHEAGHGFGLDHQAKFDAMGNLTSEYSPGPGDGRAPLMGNSYSAPRSLWWQGPTPDGVTHIQDDMTIIARPVNGFGYRPDEAGNSPSAARQLTPTGTSLAFDGVVTTIDDVDVFSIHAAAGTATFQVKTLGTFANLDSRLEVRDATGTIVLAQADPSNSLDASVSLDLAGGDYLIYVASHGQYADVGHYTLLGTLPAGSPTEPPPTDPPPPEDPPPPPTFDAPSNLVATPTSPNQIKLEWSDYASTEDGYRVERRPATGTVWTRIAQLPANTTSYTASGLTANTSYAFRVVAYKGTQLTPYSMIASAKTQPLPTRPVAPDQLRTTSVTSNSVTLTWRDRSTNEAGFRIERSANGGRTWKTLDSVAANVTSYEDLTVLPKANYLYRVRAFNVVGTSAATTALVVRTPAQIVSGAPSVGGSTTTATTRTSNGTGSVATKALVAVGTLANNALPASSAIKLTSSGSPTSTTNGTNLAGSASGSLRSAIDWWMAQGLKWT